MSVRSSFYRGLDAARWRVKCPEMLKVRQFMEESQWWAADRIKAFQDEQLRVLVNHAYKRVPYYRNVMRDRGLLPKDVATVDDLAKLPILDKQTFRERWAELLCDGVDPNNVRVRRTGGTTGEPLRIARDRNNAIYENGAFRRGLSLAGYRQGESMVKLFGGTLGLAPERWADKLKARLAGELFLPAFELGKHNVSDYVAIIRRSRARFLRGYATAVYLLASLVEQSSLKLDLQAVFPTAETLYPHQREVISKRLGTVFEYYGCAELNSIGFECSAHRGLHISQEHAHLEVLREQKPVPEGDMGAVTLTTLQNYTMPLIRYQSGDAAVLTRHPCRCGRNSTRIVQVLGRNNELLRAKDGRLIPGAFIPHLFRTTTGIEEVQVIQRTEDLIMVKIVRGDDFTESEVETVTKTIRRYLGDVAIDVKYVESIPRTSSGKLRSVVCEIAETL